MIVSAWKGWTYGIRIRRADVLKHFSKNNQPIQIKIDGKFYTFYLSQGFWSTCPEIRGGAIKNWLLLNNHKEWKKRKPPKFDLAPIENNRFRLTKI